MYVTAIYVSLTLGYYKRREKRLFKDLTHSRQYLWRSWNLNTCDPLCEKERIRLLFPERVTFVDREHLKDYFGEIILKMGD